MCGEEKQGTPPGRELPAVRAVPERAETTPESAAAIQAAEKPCCCHPEH